MSCGSWLFGTSMLPGSDCLVLESVLRELLFDLLQLLAAKICHMWRLQYAPTALQGSMDNIIVCLPLCYTAMGILQQKQNSCTNV